MKADLLRMARFLKILTHPDNRRISVKRLCSEMEEGCGAPFPCSTAYRWLAVASHEYPIRLEDGIIIHLRK